MSTTQTAPTKGPWTIHQESIDPEWYIITTPSGRIMANVHIETGNAQDQANAAHIVHCVNAHDELVQVLKDVLSELQDGPWTTIAIAKLCAALAKAEQVPS